jgi:hypothetical protein
MASGYDLSSGATRRYPLLETFDRSCRDTGAEADQRQVRRRRKFPHYRG